MDFPLSSTEIFTADITSQYITSFYYAVLLLTGNEMGPRTNLEAAVTSMIILVGYLLNANIFGEVAVLVQTIKRKTQ